MTALRPVPRVSAWTRVVVPAAELLVALREHVAKEYPRLRLRDIEDAITLAGAVSQICPSPHWKRRFVELFMYSSSNTMPRSAIRSFTISVVSGWFFS